MNGSSLRIFFDRHPLIEQWEEFQQANDKDLNAIFGYLM